METTQPSRRDSVYIEGSHHPIYKDLTEGAGAPFRYMKDVFMTAMVLGYRAGKRKPLERRHMIFKTSAFSLQEDLPLIRAVALGPDCQVESLTNENGMLTIAEEYANFGFGLLRGDVIDRPGTTVNNLMLFLMRVTEQIPPASKVAAARDDADEDSA